MFSDIVVDIYLCITPSVLQYDVLLIQLYIYED